MGVEREREGVYFAKTVTVFSMFSVCLYFSSCQHVCLYLIFIRYIQIPQALVRDVLLCVCFSPT